jgi:hypothetical protein
MVRLAPESGLKSDIAGGPFGAIQTLRDSRFLPPKVKIL